MPAKIIDQYDHVPETKEDREYLSEVYRHCLFHLANWCLSVDWAELITLDLGLYEQPGGKQELVKQLEHAVRYVGEYSLPIIL